MKNTYLILIALVVSFTTLNAQWAELVTPTINGEIRLYSSVDLEINLEGEPLLLYDVEVPSDNGKDSEWKLFVQKYNPANEEWSLVGDSYINELNADDNNLAIDSEGNIYVAYLKYGSGEEMRCRIKKFDGTEWVQIGDWSVNIFGSDVVMYCDDQDNVYVLYYDQNTYEGTVVKRYLGTGSDWETLGDEIIIPSGQCLAPALTTDNYGNVLVSFSDGALAELLLSVIKFNGSTWEYIGSPGFWGEPDYPTSIIVGNNDVIYTTTTEFWSMESTVLNRENNAWHDQYICYNAGNMPFTKFNNDIYMGHCVIDDGYRVRVKKIDGSGAWVDLPDQPDQSYITPPWPRTFIDIEADNYGNLYLAFAKGDQWTHHIVVLKLDVATGISEPQIENNTIYPNPTSGIINISIPPGEFVKRVIVTDISGKIVFQDENENSVIDLSILENGVYFVRVNTSKNTYVEKVIIQ